MIISQANREHKMQLNGKQIRQVKSYKHLGSTIEDNGKMKGAKNDRLEKTEKIFNTMKTTFFRRKEILKSTRRGH